MLVVPVRGIGIFTSEPSFTVKKLECLKQALGLNTLAWNNEIGPSRILLVARFGND